MRCHAAVIAWAHGQLAWIFRRRRRPPRTSRAAACSTRSQCLQLGFGQVAVQRQEFQPVEQDLPASAQVSPARRSRTSPCPSIAICQACSGTSRSAARSRSPSTGPAE